MAKYCVKCGYKMEDEDLVCGECGTPAARFQTSPEEIKTEVTKKNMKISKGMVLGAAVLVILVAVVAIFATRQTTVKLDEYIEITFEGYEGYGKADAIFDYDAFYADYGEKIDYVEENEMTGLISAAEALEAFCISGSLDANSGLSNGDTVTYIWNCDDASAETTFDVKLEYSDITTEVSGLEEIETVDLFDGVDIVCSGTDGYGNVNITTKGTADWNDKVTYSVNGGSYISNGDTVTVVADIRAGGSDPDTYFAQNYGVIPKAYEKEFQVSGLTAIEEFDPFEYVEVFFSGTSPDGEISVSVDKSKAYMERLIASSNKTDGLRNGDKITVTLDLEVLFYDGTTESYLAENYGVKATTLSKTYTVEGLPQYVTSLDEIPDETMKDLKSEAEDKITAYCNGDWEYPEAYGGMEYVGTYLLAAKDAIDYFSDANIALLVYSINVESYTTYFGEEDPFTFYYCVPFYNLVLQNDDSCVVNGTEFTWQQIGVNTFYKGHSIYFGYETLDLLQSQCIEANVDVYTYETDIIINAE